jgi:MYXO-CTERM domain-containing protein
LSGATDNRCLQIDDKHGIAVGTSMSSPVVAGVVALLLQADPTLTQDKVAALLQAGAHRYRTSTAFDDEAGPGEVDAMGSLDALDRMKTPKAFLPSPDASWITLSSDYVAADGSTPLTAIVELRTADAQHRGDLFDAARLSANVLLDGVPVVPQPQVIRRGPGVWFYVWNPPAGLGGSRATFGATFDNVAIVASKTLPIGPDRWTALYPNHATGSSCSASGLRASSSSSAGGGVGALGAIVALLALARRRRHSSASVTTQP